MTVNDLGAVDYKEVSAMLDKLIVKAKERGGDTLTLCTHYPVYTLGQDGGFDYGVEYIRSDRGGSITYHDLGTLMVYFTFHVQSPALFYKKVLKSLDIFFEKLYPDAAYDKNRPGYYTKGGKIASLGFRYKDGFSKHGISLHISPNLENFNKIPPCGLEGTKATSLVNEGVDIDIYEAKIEIVKAIKDVFET